MNNTFKPTKTILTAGPWISKTEIAYVNDAVQNGWNEHAFDYIEKFEKEFAKYIGVKYAISTSGGTGALWLGLATLGVGRGDEVILPDMTCPACSDVIVLTGAKPVFADIRKDTWCIDAKSIEKNITKRTKAIMPVHSYGNPAEMDEIGRIAKRHHLFIIEDACPAVGSLYQGKHPGSMGDFGAFSFQGAKIMVTGVGGMLVTNNIKLYEKADYLNMHGSAKTDKKFWQTAIGYEFKMSNLQAAFGLAQLTRIEKFVVKKRKIFDWYYKRLNSIEGISMNIELTNTRSNRWMSSIILDKDFGITRDELRLKLMEKKIDTRPFFFPISMFPMFKDAKTPVSHHVGLDGINLPSGLMLTEAEVDYIARTVRKILLP
jgi:perosamine synthetase